ncbi:MAG: peptidase M64 [Bacteroidales bacterium]|nr:peptidase M64 [Bacteroidales bacterium]
MKHFVVFFFLLATLSSFAQNVDFDQYFINKSLRMDFIHAGNSDTGYIYFEKLKQEPYWGGSHKNLIDTFNYGEYRVLVFDKASNKLIYSRGYATLFQEWKATSEAKEMSRSFYEGVVVPFPKSSVWITIEEKDNLNNFREIFRKEIKPNDIFIEKGLKYDFKTDKILDNGDPANKVDIVFIAEGYTKNQIDKFKNDVKRLTDSLFSYEPFKSQKNNFNIHIVESFSEEEGTDVPGKNIWKNTIVNSNFYTFGTERYLTTQDFESVRDIAALAPYDQIYILVNTPKYGGGGIYNFYNLCVSDNSASHLVLIHEFGHGFGGLADEYWTSDVAVEEYYPTSLEPADPNITTLVNFNAKWADMVDKSTPIPTPATEKNMQAIGVFEGGGYVEKGVYRPQQNCMMRALAYPFCKVCQRALDRMIRFYSE